jgi:small subunit ribosomal protein S21
MKNNHRGKNRKFSNREHSGVPVRIPGANVEVRNDDVNGALRRLKKILETSNRQKELAKHEYYEKPSAVRKRERAQAVKRAHKEQIKRDPVLKAQSSRSHRKKR